MEASLVGPSGNIALTSSALTIGRAADNTLVVSDPQSSSHHAEIRPDAQGYSLVDLNSTNGTFVNEQPLAPQSPRLLMPGDVIRIGTTKFTYELPGSNDATIRANARDYAGQGYQPTVPSPPVPPPSYNPAPQQGYQGYQSYPAYPSSSPQQAQPPSAYGEYGQGQGGGAAQPYPQPGYQQPQNNTAPQGYPPPQGNYQQQWGAAPGQLGAPPQAPPRKRNRTGLVIGLVVLLLLLVGGGVAGYLVLRSTPEKTLQAYCTALLNNDAQGVYNQLSAHAQSQTSVAKISQGLQTLSDPRIGGFKTCTYSNVQQNGSSATATIKYTVGNTLVPPLTSNDVLIDENGTWKLDRAQTPTAPGQQ